MGNRIAEIHTTDTENKLHHYAGSWKYGVVVGVLASAGALVGTLETDAIKGAFPFCGWAGIHGYPWNPREWIWTTSGWVYIFWIITFAWLVLFIFRQAAESESLGKLQRQSTELVDGVVTVRQDVKSIQDAAGELQKQSKAVIENVGDIGQSVSKVTESAGNILSDTRQIRDTLWDTNKSAAALVKSIDSANRKIEEVNYSVQTLPSKTFRTELASKATVIYALLAEAFPRGASPSGDPETSIRLALIQLVNLRMIYEGNQRARYAANIMLFLENEGQTTLSTEVMQKVRLLAPDETVQPRDLKGALVLTKRLSTSTDSPQKEDALVPEIALGIPRKEDDGPSAWLIPGAARAFVESRRALDAYCVSGYHDTAEIYRLAEKGYQIPPSMMRRMKTYFEKEPRLIKSYISLPLLRPGGKAFGILNIHSNYPYTSGEDLERQVNFGLIVAPLVHQVAEVCQNWKPIA